MTENHKQMKSTTRSGGGEVHRRPVVGKDCIFKVSTFLEILIFDKIHKLLVLLQLQQHPHVIESHHRDPTKTPRSLVGAVETAINTSEEQEQGRK
jgi:hypothetical protein